MAPLPAERNGCLVVGWDVGGWLGRKHGVAAALCSKESGVTWVGDPSAIRMPPPSATSWRAIVLSAGCPADVVDDAHSIVIAVDSPLGFPSAFAKLVSGSRWSPPLARTEIESLLAYRETDRVVHGAWGRKPLSAAFDRLGNNATVAIAHMREWCSVGGFCCPPISPRMTSRVVIEVYPALVKPRDGRGSALSWIDELVPPQVIRGSDAYDAALCAVHAAAYFLDGQGELPSLEGPPEFLTNPSEGWIYYFANPASPGTTD